MTTSARRLGFDETALHRLAVVLDVPLLRGSGCRSGNQRDHMEDDSVVTSATLIRFVAGTFGQRDEVIATDEELDSLIGRVREALGDAEIADGATDEERDRATLRKLGSAPINGIVVNDLTNGRTYLPPQAVARITSDAQAAPSRTDADEVRQHLIELHGMPPKLLVHETAESMRDGLHVVLHDDVGGPWSGHHEHAALYTRPEPS